MTDPEPTLAALPSGVRLALASQRTDSADVWWMCWRIFDGEFDIGGVDYWTCQRCRLVLLGEIGIIDSYQRRGIGRDVLEHLRARLPGYRWRLTLTKPASRPFWAASSSSTPPGEYSYREPVCDHITDAL